MKTLAHVMTFVRVVQGGSFAAGARRLNLAPAVASKHVAMLEKRLGARLLNRSTRKLSPTEAGSAYYEHCLRMLDTVEASHNALARLRSEPSGRLRVSALASFTNAVLAPLLPGFFRRHPKVEIEIVCSDRNVDLAEEGFDVALRITSTPAPHLVARRLASIRFQALASPAYLKRHGTPCTPADLARHRCLGYPQSLAAGAWRFVHGHRTIDAPVHSVFQANSVEALRQLALAGEGIALLPTYAVGAELASGRLVAPMPQYGGSGESTLYAVYLPNRHGSPKLRAFCDYLAASFGKVAPWEAGPRARS